MVDRLNELTKAELDEIRMKTVRQSRPCLWCEREALMRADQRFCMAKCRAAYAAAAARMQYEHMLRERERWLLERRELQMEIQRLKEEVKALKLGDI